MFSKCVSYDEYNDIVIVKMRLGFLLTGETLYNRYAYYRFKVNEYGGFDYYPEKNNKKVLFFIAGYFLLIIGLMLIPALLKSEIETNTLIIGSISFILIVASIIAFVVWDNHNKVKAAKRYLEFNYDFDSKK